jgi:hypothetical protein
MYIILTVPFDFPFRVRIMHFGVGEVIFVFNYLLLLNTLD